LLKLWPWRISGEQGLADRWLTPAEYATLTGEGSQLALALLSALLAAVLVWLLYRVAPVHNVAQGS
jgi:putative membrane protein